MREKKGQPMKADTSDYVGSKKKKKVTERESFVRKSG